ncbi:hypothetical protein A2Y85_05490 [candidate division WOR-3 bacterium RBG_13_43_14]|uniref:Guanylate cyclase domain-containing protein n=1 Tax=candidate division WOR-3 bacterium RBG_13_43_14 TaxID=1802590 RepID=A0A1F4UF46_UNCW3|nr:MAG: hypothetical protein A2Y85_05490 [candidate division WOR-3 bacterium RBG_13_43_14]
MSVFLFTDIEGSTQKWEKYPEAMKQALIKHDELIDDMVIKHGGKIVKHTGDGVFAVFEGSGSLQCALDIQINLGAENWGEAIGELRIRMGLHAGNAEKYGNDYFGPVVNRAARVMSAAWGGQIILTPTVLNSVVLPDGAEIIDLGSHMLKDLGEPQALYQLDHPGLLVKNFPTLRSLSARPNNLPVQNTPFMGRDRELEDIKRLLDDPKCRLLTLIGTGGTGKTRLAIQAAAERLERFPQGVYFVPLTALRSADLIASAIAEAMNFKFYTRENEKIQLANYLREKEMVIILDNFEHVVEGAGIIADILNAAPGVKIMVTSRELLNLKGEWVFQVEGLNVPKTPTVEIEGYSAVQLFLYNARRIDTDFSLKKKEEVVSVTKICQLVGGLPLGIELASSWLRSLSCREIAQEIEKSLDFLSTVMRDVPERHRSMRAVFDYSWNLMNAEEKRVLKRLSVFRGGFSREAATKVTGASLTVLSLLLDKSLIRRNPEGRYDILEMVRQYASEKINENPDEEKDIRQKHCLYYTDLLDDYQARIIFTEQHTILLGIMSDLENYRSAWQTAITDNMPVQIDHALASLAVFYEVNGLYREGEKMFSEALAMVETDQKLEADQIIAGRLMARLATFLYRLGQYSEARSMLEISLVIFRKSGSKDDNAFALNLMGNVENLLSNYKPAKLYYQESLMLYEELNIAWGIQGAYNNLGVIEYCNEKYDDAQKLFDKCLKICEQAGYKRGIATALGNTGLVLQGQGKYKESIDVFVQSLEIEKEVNNVTGIASSYHNLGLTYATSGDYVKAREYYEMALNIRRDIGDRMGISISYNNLGNLAANTGHYNEAVELHNKSLSIRNEIGDHLGAAQSLLNLGSAYDRDGQHDEASRNLFSALKAFSEYEGEAYITSCLSVIARHYFNSGDYQQALLLHSFIIKHNKIDDYTRETLDEYWEKLKTSISRQEIEKANVFVRGLSLKELLKSMLKTKKVSEKY